ncbi:unnamed protein product [Kuraishia capsulata CBS 1993]|uniref:Mitochondrial import receptor subunit TOM40 n=1 Tax=Kuraishia capsulata CBS 1993 TaxID=1382522 RepID=W6MLP1_9ASCO|nr:uncharacterized protein KUCA_T00003005001 [Kuraishia capsulata CBS 1993]CDK27028.1 unnamed protein product [Kuraishia capsulata CBS 1993]
MSSVPSLGELAKSVSPLAGLTQSKPQADGFWSANPVFSYLNNVYSSIAQHRQSLDLANPGTVENLNKEVTRDVFLNQYFFTGLKVDFNKAFSMNPAFQTSHSLSIGSQVLPPYAFSAVVANDNVLFQGNVDNELNVSGRCHINWDKHNVSKVSLQLAKSEPSMVQLEQDYQTVDSSLNFKVLNPSFLYEDKFTGVAVGSILQSVTPRLALGLEAFYSAQPSAPGQAAVSYMTRYNAGDWIATANAGLTQGNFNASFWKRVGDKVEAGIETDFKMGIEPITDEMMRPIGFQPVVEAKTTLGAKYEFRQSIFRGQVDSQGKVSCFMEKRLLPILSVLFSAEIDQFKNTSRVGIGMQFESAGTVEIAQMQAGYIDQNGNPVPGAPPLA